MRVRYRAGERYGGEWWYQDVFHRECGPQEVWDDTADWVLADYGIWEGLYAGETH